MNKREAKQIVCGAVSALLDNGSPNEFLYIKPNGDDYSPKDTLRLKKAFDDLAQELYNRSGKE